MNVCEYQKTSCWAILIILIVIITTIIIIMQVREIIKKMMGKSEEKKLVKEEEKMKKWMKIMGRKKLRKLKKPSKIRGDQGQSAEIWKNYF